MIVHHEQALFMSELASENKLNRLSTWLTKLKLPGRRNKFMEGWLAERDEVAMNMDHGMSGSDHKMNMHANMVGMATPQQLAQLEKSKGTDFDRLFST